MLKIKTKYHGEIEMKEEVVEFEKGIPGFLDENQFAILPFSDDHIFFILQSANTPELAFVVTSPFHFFKEYDIELDNNTIEQLEINSEKDVSVFTILTVQDPFEKTTANLQAPIVINEKKQIGKQVILTNTNYQTKHSIFQREKTTAK